MERQWIVFLIGGVYIRLEVDIIRQFFGELVLYDPSAPYQMRNSGIIDYSW